MHCYISRALCGAWIAIASTLCVPAFAAQTGYLLMIEGIEGESAASARTSDDHSRRIEILSYSWGAGRRAGHEMPGASGRVANGPPLPQDGSLTVQGRFPGCQVGKRYAGAQFAGGGVNYQLADVVITDCAAESLSLKYGKVRVRGWDPEKKEL